MADELAGAAANLETLDLPIPAQDALRWAGDRIRLAWEQAWLGERDLFLRQVKPTTLPGTDRRDQAEQRALTRLRIGHTRHTHAGIFTGTRHDCTTCNQPLTVQHILLECQTLDGYRAAAGLAGSLYDILNNDRDTETKLINFLRRADLLNKI